MRGGLAPHETLGIETPPPRPTGDLLKLSYGQQPSLDPVKLAQLGEEHGADRDVHPHAQRVRPAYALQQTFPRETFHEEPVLWKETGVVDADAEGDVPPELVTNRGVKLEPAELGVERLLLVRRQREGAAQVLRAFVRLSLREVDDVHGCPVGIDEFLDALDQGRLSVLKLERHRPFPAAHDPDVPSRRVPLEVPLELSGVAEGGGHEEELGVRDLHHGNLPRPPSIGVGVKVKLVGDYEAAVQVPSPAERRVGEYLRGAAYDGRGGVDGRVAGEQTHVLGAKVLHELKELLGDQRLEGRGVPRGVTPRRRRRDRRGGHHRLATPCRRGQEHVVTLDELQDGLLLRLVQLHALDVHRPL